MGASLDEYHRRMERHIAEETDRQEKAIREELVRRIADALMPTNFFLQRGDAEHLANIAVDVLAKYSLEGTMPK